MHFSSIPLLRYCSILGDVESLHQNYFSKIKKHEKQHQHTGYIHTVND